MNTIADIAKKANVSKATVSKVINGYSGVSEKTRQIVTKVMREHNYWPSATARSLTTKQSYIIGLFMASDLNNSFFREVIPGIEKVLGSTGYDILYFADKQRGNTGTNYGYLEKCRDRQVDGAIMLSYIRDELADFDQLLDSEIPSVYVDMNLEGPHASYVISNNVKSAQLAVKYLYDLGHRKIGFIDGTNLSIPVEQRLKGFRKAVKDLDIYTDSNWFFHGAFTEEFGYESMLKLSKMENRPTAVIAQDNIAIGVIRALRDNGYNVPHDLSIVGFDDIEISSHYGLTTVQQKKSDMGEAAARLLVDIINNQPYTPITIDTELVIRSSCRPI